ncbi:alpha/beta fold hydrolase [Flavobacteriaceae bacterium M23B6Z8]
MALLHSKILGQGEPLIILHGFLGMSDNWKTLGNYYSEKGFEVHLVDQRNHGRSFHSDTFSYHLLSEDLKAYIDHHKLDEVYLIGHSMGGKTAMYFAQNFPKHVKKLIVADIAPRYYPVHHQDILNGLNAVNLENMESRNDADDQLKKHITDFGIRQFLLKNLYRKTKDRFDWRMNLPVLSLLIEQVGEATPVDQKFQGQTLFIKGGKSNYIREEDAALIQNLFPNAEVKTIESAGHWLHAEKPEEFLDISMQFFKKN